MFISYYLLMRGQDQIQRQLFTEKVKNSKFAEGWKMGERKEGEGKEWEVGEERREDRRKGRIKNRRKEKEERKNKKNMFSKMAFTNEYTLEKKYHKNVSLHFLKQNKIYLT